MRSVVKYAKIARIVLKINIVVSRNPWQYLLEKIYKQDKDFILQSIPLFILIGFLFWFSIFWIFQNYSNISTLIILWVIFYWVISLRKLLSTEKKKNTITKTIKKWINWERLTSFELSLLQWKKTDFYVINDFQIKEWEKLNIDHIIICTNWIFAIETKNLSSVKNKWVRESKQVRYEAKILQEILKDKFSINWVNPILCIINLENLRYIESTKYFSPVYYKDIGIYLEKKYPYNIIENPEEIFLFLTSLQQKNNHNY